MCRIIGNIHYCILLGCNVWIFHHRNHYHSELLGEHDMMSLMIHQKSDIISIKLDKPQFGSDPLTKSLHCILTSNIKLLLNKNLRATIYIYENDILLTIMNFNKHVELDGTISVFEDSSLIALRTYHQGKLMNIKSVKSGVVTSDIDYSWEVTNVSSTYSKEHCRFCDDEFSNKYTKERHETHFCKNKYGK